MPETIEISGKEYKIDEDGQIIGEYACCFANDHFSHPYCYSLLKLKNKVRSLVTITELVGTGMYRWKVVPISPEQKLDVNPNDLLNNGDFRQCNTYKGGGGYDHFPALAKKYFGEDFHNEYCQTSCLVVRTRN